LFFVNEPSQNFASLLLNIQKAWQTEHQQNMSSKNNSLLPPLKLRSNLKTFIPFRTTKVLIWNLARAQILCHITNFISYLQSTVLQTLLGAILKTKSKKIIPRKYTSHPSNELQRSYFPILPLTWFQAILVFQPFHDNNCKSYRRL